MTKPAEFELITLAEAGRQANLHPTTLKQQIRNARLQAVKRGNLWFTRKDWLDEYLASRQNAGGPGRGGKK